MKDGIFKRGRDGKEKEQKITSKKEEMKIQITLKGREEGKLKNVLKGKEGTGKEWKSVAYIVA